MKEREDGWMDGWISNGRMGVGGVINDEWKEGRMGRWMEWVVNG